MNFNYTHTLDILVKRLQWTINNNEGNVEHFRVKHLQIHGSTSESIIIGIDNVNELPSTCALSPYIGSYCVKSDMKNLLGNKNESLYDDIISKSDIIIAYGLSFGTSDKSRWEILKQWLLVDESNHTLVVYQYEPEFSNNKMCSLKAYIPEYLRKINEIKINFLIDKLNIDIITAHDPKMLKRIVLIDSDKVLDFKLTNDKEKQTT